MKRRRHGVRSLPNRTEQLTRDLAALKASWQLLLREPLVAGNGQSPSAAHRSDLLEAYWRLLQCISQELAQSSRAASSTGSLTRRYVQVIDETAADSIDCLNYILEHSQGRPLAQVLAEGLWESLAVRLPAGASDEQLACDAQVHHMLLHASQLARLGVEVPRAYMQRLKAACKAVPGLPSRLMPTELGSLAQDAALLDPSKVDAQALGRIRERIASRDQFAGSRAFRAYGGKVLPSVVGEIRAADDFYGYRHERRFFLEHFTAFAGGAKVPPLLLSGLPGLGKTHFTIAFTFASPELVLVTSEQGQLGAELEPLVATLGRHPHRRFVLFFDDVDAEDLDWSHFRNQVEGFLPYPSNVAMVVASNYSFPAAVRSRCVVFEFRPMGPAVCQEMVEDYLKRNMHIAQPRPDLVNTVVADYTNEYVNGLLDELTPRSLVRYLQMLENGELRRERIYTESATGYVRQPLEELFIAANRRVEEQMHRKGQWGSIAKVKPAD
jgi:hypothetical protein